MKTFEMVPSATNPSRLRKIPSKALTFRDSILASTPLRELVLLIAGFRQRTWFLRTLTMAALTPRFQSRPRSFRTGTAIRVNVGFRQADGSKPSSLMPRDMVIRTRASLNLLARSVARQARVNVLCLQGIRGRPRGIGVRSFN